MNPSPKISIITVSYNEEKDIEKTCRSVTEQTFQDFEWLVIDGGSTDRTLEIVANYSDRIAKLVSEKDKGIYDGMNKGIRLANGEYLLFLNSGDSLLDKNVLKNIFEGRKYTSDILYGDCMSQQKDGTLLEWNQPEDVTMAFLCSFTGINHQSAFIKRDLFSKFGLYDLSYKSAADSEKWCCFLENGCLYEKVSTKIALVKGFDGMSSSPANRELIKREQARIVARYYRENPTTNAFTKVKRMIPQELKTVIKRVIGRS